MLIEEYSVYCKCFVNKRLKEINCLKKLLGYKLFFLNTL